jgi:hypothetical protein
VTNLDRGGSGVVQGGFETLIANHQIVAGEKGHYGTFTHTGIPDHQDGLGVLFVDGDGLETIVDQLLEPGQVDGV